MNLKVISGWYVFINDDGEDQKRPHPDALLEAAGTYPQGLVVTGLPNDPQDPGDGRRVWNITGLNQAAVDVINADPLCEVLS